MSKIHALCGFLALCVILLMSGRRRAMNATEPADPQACMASASWWIDLPRECLPVTLAKNVIQQTLNPAAESGYSGDQSSRERPVLHVSPGTLVSGDSRLPPINMTVQVEQRVTLARDPANLHDRVHVEVGSFGTVSKTNLGDLRDSIKTKSIGSSMRISGKSAINRALSAARGASSC